MFPLLSSSRIHLNSRCLSQAVFDSGSVDVDAEVIRPSLWRGSVQCCRSRRWLVPVQGPSAVPGRDPAGSSAGWMRCWQLRGALGALPIAFGCAALRACPYKRCRQRARLLRIAGSKCCAAPHPSLGPEQECVTESSPALGSVDARSMQISLISGVRNFSPTALQLKSLLLFVLARKSYQGTGGVQKKKKS